jgi:hypothetical protein
VFDICSDLWITIINKKGDCHGHFELFVLLKVICMLVYEMMIHACQSALQKQCFIDLMCFTSIGNFDVFRETLIK